MNISSKFRHIIAFSILAVTLALLYSFRQTLPMFILALFFAYVLTPLIVWITSKKIFGRKISRGLAVILVYLIMTTGVSFGGAYFIINLTNEIQVLIKDIPSYGEKLTQIWVPTISEGIKTVSNYLPTIENPTTEKEEIEEEQKRVKYSSKPGEKNELLAFFKNTRFRVKQDKNGFEIIPQEIAYQQQQADVQKFDFAEYVNHFISDIFANLQSILLGFLNFGQVVVFSVVTSIFQTFITFMIAAFMIIDHEKIMKYFLDLFPTRFLSRVEMFLQKQHAGLAGVVRGQLIICLVNGTLTGIGLFILDIKFALTLSLVATVCSIIPIFGVIISSVPIVLMAITGSLVTGLFALGWILIIHFIEGNILNPKIIGKSAEIHPVLVIFALMAGENAYGIFGALIAVPLFSIFQNTFLFIQEVLFSDDDQSDNSNENDKKMRKFAIMDE